MNELALFAGAGGGILGGKLLGWRTVCAVEWEAYPASVLLARQNDGLLTPFPIWDDVQTFDGKPWRGIVDVVSGGFPCQDISAAGKGAGIDGERSGMWKEMARIIGEVRPKYVFVENSPMLTSRGLGTVLGDLASLGFDAEWGVLGAADVGANHQRDRIWIVGKTTNAKCIGLQKTTDQQKLESQRSNQLQIEQSRNSSEMANTMCNRLDGGCTKWNRNSQFAICKNKPNNRNKIWCKTNFCSNTNGKTKISNSASIGQQGQREHEQSINSTQNCKRKANYAESIGSSKFWSVEPNVGRVVNGLASRMDRLKAIGNGQVPLCAATAWNILRERLENGM